MVLTGITAGFSEPEDNNDAPELLAIRFDYKEDVWRYQAVSDVMYSNWNVPELRTTEGISTGTAQNHTESPQEFSFSFEEDMAVTVSLSFTAGVESSTTAEGDVGVPFVASGEVSETFTMSASLTVGGSATVNKSFSCETRVLVQPGECVNARTTVQKYTCKGDFTSKVSDVYSHAGAVSRTGTAFLVQGHDVIVSYETVEI